MAWVFRGATSLVFALPVVAAWRTPTLSWSAAGLLMLITAATLARPAAGLLLFAGLYPMAPPLSLLLGQPAFAEQLALSFLAAAFLNAAVSRLDHHTQLPRPVLLLGAMLASSAIVALSGQQLWWGEPRPYLAALWRHLTHTYFVESEFVPLHETMLWLEAIAVAVAAERIVRASAEPGRAIARMFVFGGATLSASSALRLAEISVRQEAPFSAALEFLGRVRLNTYFQDINAAGSIYAMFFVAAAWLTWRRSRTWALGTILLGMAVWLAGSRAAFGGAVGALGFLWLVSYRPRLRTVLLASSAAVVLLAVVAVSTPRNASLGRASGFRVEITRAGLALATEQPLVGLGLNMFKSASMRALPADFGQRFRFADRGENAHNNFLQILVELGAIGLFAFLWVVVTPVRNIARAGLATIAPEAAALCGGVAALLLSALLGHPLLDEKIRLMFFLAVGLATGLSPSTAPAGGRWSTAVVALATLFVAVTLPGRAMTHRRAEPLAGLVRGTSEVQDALDGVTYRIADAHSTWFIAGDTRMLTIPLRTQGKGAAPCMVELAVDGQPGDRLSVETGRWQPSQFALPPLAEHQSWRRVDVAVATEGCTLLVGPLTTR